MSVIEDGVAGRFHLPATSLEVTYARFDQPGAAGASAREAATLANAAAGVVVGKLGTATVLPRELLAAMAEPAQN